MNDAIAEVRPCFQFDDGGELGLESPDAGWTGALSRMLSVAMEAMKDDRWERLKACWNPACRAVFYDTSPNRSGKWCTVKRCGNRANTRTYRKAEFLRRVDQQRPWSTASVFNSPNRVSWPLILSGELDLGSSAALVLLGEHDPGSSAALILFGGINPEAVPH